MRPDARETDAGTEDASRDAFSPDVPDAPSVHSGDLSVFVTDAVGRPRGNVSVRVRDRSAVTTATGEARFVLPEGPVTVSAFEAGGVVVHANAEVAGGDQTELAVELPHVVTQEVALAEDRVTVVNAAGAELTLPPRGAYTDPSGARYDGPVSLRVADLTEHLLPTEPAPEELTLLDIEIALFTPDDRPLQPTTPIRYRRTLDETLELFRDAFVDGSVEHQSFNVELGAWVNEPPMRLVGDVLETELRHLSRWRQWTRLGFPMRCISVDASRVRRFQILVAYSGTTTARLRRHRRANRRSGCQLVPVVGSMAAGLTIEGVRIHARSGLEHSVVELDVTAGPAGGDRCDTTEGCLEVALEVPPSPMPSCVEAGDPCNDGNPCTADTCDPAPCPSPPCTGCTNEVQVGLACDDGNACTADEQCDAVGVCVGGAPPACDDGDDCTSDHCDTVLGGCTTDPLCAYDPNASCAAGACVCEAGHTRRGGPLCRADAVSCATLADRIDAELGCAGFARAPFEGDDECGRVERIGGDPCAGAGAALLRCVNDHFGAALVCGGEAASGVSVLVETGPCASFVDAFDACLDPPDCGALPDGATCSDGNPCTVVDECRGGACEGTPMDCSGVDDACNDGVCMDGGCVAAPRVGSPCDDGDACTNDDVCEGTPAVCAGRPRTDCEGMGDECNAGVCRDGTCTTVPLDGTFCDDGDACTTDDRCAAGSCRPGTAMDCSSFDTPCATGVCDGGACRPMDRSEGSTCTLADACLMASTCRASICTPGTASMCVPGSTHPGAESTIRGGAGGTPFTEDCPAGQVLRGFDVTLDGTNQHWQGMVPVCDALQVDGTEPFAVSRSDGARLSTYGSLGAIDTARCPAGQVVVGLEGRSGTAIDQIALRCAPFSSFARAGSTEPTHGEVAVVGDHGMLATQPAVGGPGGAPFSASDCNLVEGHLAIGIVGRSSALQIEALGLRCGSVSAP